MLIKDMQKKVFREFKMNNLGDYYDLYDFKVTLYYLQMYFRILEISGLKYIALILFIFCQHLD